jgi:hypothetical protein
MNVRSIIMFVNFYRIFIRKYGKINITSTDLTRKGKPFNKQNANKKRLKN